MPFSTTNATRLRTGADAATTATSPAGTGSTLIGASLVRAGVAPSSTASRPTAAGAASRPTATASA